MERQIRVPDAALLWSHLGAKYDAEIAAALQRQARAGNALLLLDGLDEVQVNDDGWPLNVVRDSITMLPDALGRGSRILVTCRVLDYGDYPPRRLPGWPDERLAPLSDELRLTFVERYYRALLALNRLDVARATELQKSLARSIQTRRELARLAGNPLLLTMMAQVHTSEGQLPGTRVQLYDLCVRWLMSRWNPRPGERPLGEQLGMREWNESNLYELMELIGHTAHLHGTFPDSESGADLSYSIMRNVVSGYFNPTADPHRQAESDGRAAIFAGYISRASNGLLQVHAERGARQAIYRFPHRTFQEYLAGRALTDDGLRLPDEEADAGRDLVTRALRYVDAGAQWREALLLAASHSALNGRAGDVADLARELLPQDGVPLDEAVAQRIIIAGEMLAEAGRDRVARLGGSRARVWGDAVNWLLRLLPHLPATPVPPIPPPIRARAGIALAQLGDPRPGVCTLPAGLDDPYWAREIPAGTYTIGTQRDPFNDETFKPVQLTLGAFRIARYPVTVWQYRQFVAAGGYEGAQWWAEEGREWRTQLWPPYQWDDPDWTADNQPVIGVSWYEAMAFCKWLKRQVTLPEGWEIRLPGEAEWEVAAMWDADAGVMRAWQPPANELWQNVAEAGIGRTCPVGLFPQGASPCGALDMAGNVWEWCASHDDDYPAKAHRVRDDFAPGKLGPALRGGAYWNENISSGWGARYGGDPDVRDVDRGFRILVRSRFAH